MATEFAERLLELSNQAAQKGEVPISALLVKNDQIITEAHNQTEQKALFTAHAELIVLEQATRKLGTKYLNETDLYVSVEPCQMCLGAAKLSRVKNIFFLCSSEKFGEQGRAYYKSLVSPLKLEDYEKRQQALMNKFFQDLRDSGNKD